MADTLYHYCSNEAFVSIITERKIRLSLLTLSNDTDEGRHARALLLHSARGHLRSKERMLKEFDGMFGPDLGAIGCCLSEDGDLLSQWRGYAANATGVAIGFQRWALSEMVSQENADGSKFEPAYSLKPVIYAGSDQSKIMEPLVTAFIDYYDSGKGQREPSDPEFLTEHRELMMMLYDFDEHLFVLKSDFFREEKEHRLLRQMRMYSAPRDLWACQFRAKGERIVPFKEFPSNGPLLPYSIAEVVLGPRNSTPAAIIDAFLSQHGFAVPKVRRSRGTFR